MKYWLLVLFMLCGCTTTSISTCRSLCKDGKVDLYRDDNVECKCSIKHGGVLEEK
jgi:hypothetical protein